MLPEQDLINKTVCARKALSTPGGRVPQANLKLTDQGIEKVRPRAWNKWRIMGGWIRINELDGAIELLGLGVR